VLYAQKRGKSFKKNNERRYVREMRLIRLSARLLQIRLMAKAKPMAKTRIRIMIN
jgi:hypothetical protein